MNRRTFSPFTLHPSPFRPATLGRLTPTPLLPTFSPVNVTLSIDDEVLARARELASRQGTSVDQLIRSYLEGLSSDLASEEVIAELDHLWAESAGNSAGRPWSREELHERTGVR